MLRYKKVYITVVGSDDKENDIKAKVSVDRNGDRVCCGDLVKVEFTFDSSWDDNTMKYVTINDGERVVQRLMCADDTFFVPGHMTTGDHLSFIVEAYRMPVNGSFFYEDGSWYIRDETDGRSARSGADGYVLDDEDDGNSFAAEDGSGDFVVSSGPIDSDVQEDRPMTVDTSDEPIMIWR